MFKYLVEQDTSSFNPSEQGQSDPAEVYTYPQRAIQLLLVAYAAPSHSDKRGSSVSAAADLLQTYTTIIKPGARAIDTARPHWTREGLQAAFPFTKHLLRDGEPSLDVAPSSGDWAVDLVAANDYVDRVRAFGEWSTQQPDKTLLALEEKQRREWLVSGGAIDPATLFDWWGERKYAAKLLMENGQGDILDTYWPDNQELRVTPPQRYQQDRILSNPA